MENETGSIPPEEYTAFHDSSIPYHPVFTPLMAIDEIIGEMQDEMKCMKTEIDLLKKNKMENEKKQEGTYYEPVNVKAPTFRDLVEAVPVNNALDPEAILGQLSSIKGRLDEIECKIWTLEKSIDVMMSFRQFNKFTTGWYNRLQRLAYAGIVIGTVSLIGVVVHCFF